MAVAGGTLKHEHGAGHHEMSDALYEEIRGHRLLGFTLFLISDCILFSAFIFAYLYLRNTIDHWPPPGIEGPNLLFGALNSVVLFGSGATMHYALESWKHGNTKLFYRWLGLTLFLGLWFLLGQGYEYSDLYYRQHATWAGSIFGASFFTLTGLHGFHVFVGLIYLSVVWLQTRAGVYTRQRFFGLTAATLYWHFVDVIWVFLFFLFYIF
jgi:cytochrome c oxidase subunit 3